MKKLLIAFAVCLLFSSCSSDKTQDATASCEPAKPECANAASCPMMQKPSAPKINDPTNGDYERMNEHFYNQKRCLFMDVPSKNYDVIRWNKFM